MILKRNFSRKTYFEDELSKFGGDFYNFFEVVLKL